MYSLVFQMLKPTTKWEEINYLMILGTEPPGLLAPKD